MEIVLIRGLPGSGKSTLAKRLVKNSGYTHVEADMYFETAEGYKFDQDKLKQAHKYCQDKVEAYLISGKDVVVSNTFIQFWEMKPYYDIAAKYGADICVLVAEENFRNIHSVPEEVIERMQRRWQA